MDVSTKIAGVGLRNPTVLAAGILGTSADLLCRVAKCGAGAVTSKSCSLEPRDGHPNPTALDWGEGLINAIGLANPGAEEEVKELRKAVAKAGVPVFASVFGKSPEEFAEVAARVVEAKPALVELNVSCPNVSGDARFGGRLFAFDAKLVAKITEAVKNRVSTPVSVKLSPNAPDLKEVAQAAEDAGADAITACNSFGPGMVIDVETGKPVLSNRVGGVSGPAIKPLAVKCVYDVCSAVEVPVIATGGVTTGRDAVEMIMAGATAVGVGSAVYYRGVSVFARIDAEIKAFMDSHGFESLADFRAVAQQ
ncbi:MAG: dihydroorotate dehydrogenase [Candidatus Micrarchaeota archaeon]